MIGADGTPFLMDVEPRRAVKVDVKGKGVDRSTLSSSSTTTQEEEETAPTTVEEDLTATATAFFNKLSTQISTSSNVVELQKNLHTFQNNLSTNLSTLPSSLSHLSSTLPNTISTNLSTLGKGILKAEDDANEFLHKGEEWLNEMGGEVGRYVVSVVPSASTSFHPSSSSTSASVGAAMGRKETLIKRLRSDVTLLYIDPARDESDETRTSFSDFLIALEELGGFEGEIFGKRIAKELAESRRYDGDLQRTFEKMTMGEDKDDDGNVRLEKDVFWGRYFFRKGEIEVDGTLRPTLASFSLIILIYELCNRVEEEASSARYVSSHLGPLLSKRHTDINHPAATVVDEDFSWDMEEEEEESAATRSADTTVTASASVEETTPTKSSSPIIPTSPSPPPPVIADAAISPTDANESNAVSNSTGSTGSTRTSFDIVSGNQSTASTLSPIIPAHASDSPSLTSELELSHETNTRAAVDAVVRDEVVRSVVHDDALAPSESVEAPKKDEDSEKAEEGSGDDSDWE